MKIYVLSLTLLLILSAHSVAAEIDLNKAKSLLDSNKTFEALKIVAPCLKSSSTKSISNLEECLYSGENIAEEAVKELNKRFQKAFDAGESFPTWEGLSPYQSLGLELGYDSPGANIVYENDFFKHLQVVFPKSKYREEIEYTLINKRASVNNWQGWISDLENYLREFPNGRYSLSIKYELAQIYDDLWNLSEPSHDHSYLVVEFEQSAELAKKYKQKALTLYQAVANASNKSTLSLEDINDAKQRLTALPKGIVKNGFIILQGYD